MKYMPAIENPKPIGAMPGGVPKFPEVILDLTKNLLPGFGNIQLLQKSSPNSGLYSVLGIDCEALFFTSMQFFEDLVKPFPEIDYRIKINNPQYYITYQRQGLGKWVLIEQGEGFA